VLRLIETDDEDIKKEVFKAKYGTIVEGIAITGIYWDKAFYPLFLMRRLLYSAILTTMISYPTVQLVMCVFATIIPVLCLRYTRRCYCIWCW
jgi:hypothetical protein